MSIDLATGTNSYVSLGNAVDVQTTLPITLACVFSSSGLATGLRGLYSQGGYNDAHGYGSFIFAASKAGMFTDTGGATYEGDGGTAAITPDHGWYLYLMNLYQVAGITYSHVAIYSYTDATWTTDESFTDIGSGVPSSPVSGETTVIGANVISAIGNYLGLKLSWIAIWNNDFGGASLTSSSRTTNLLSNGAWGAINNDYRLFIPFSNAAIDQSGNHFDGTVVGGATYAEAGPNEAPPSIYADLTGSDSLVAALTGIGVIAAGLAGSSAITADLLNGAVSPIAADLVGGNSLTANLGKAGFMIADIAAGTSDPQDIAAAVWQYLIESGFTAKDFMRVMGAAMAGEVAGAQNQHPVFENVSGGHSVIDAQTDAYGNRISVTLDTSY